MMRCSGVGVRKCDEVTAGELGGVQVGSEQAGQGGGEGCEVGG